MANTLRRLTLPSSSKLSYLEKLLGGSPPELWWNIGPVGISHSIKQLAKNLFFKMKKEWNVRSLGTKCLGVDYTLLAAFLFFYFCNSRNVIFWDPPFPSLTHLYPLAWIYRSLLVAPSRGCVPSIVWCHQSSRRVDCIPLLPASPLCCADLQGRCALSVPCSLPSSPLACLLANLHGSIHTALLGLSGYSVLLFETFLRRRKGLETVSQVCTCLIALPFRSVHTPWVYLRSRSPSPSVPHLTFRLRGQALLMDCNVLLVFIVHLPGVCTPRGGGLCCSLCFFRFPHRFSLASASLLFLRLCSRC